MSKTCKPYLIEFRAEDQKCIRTQISKAIVKEAEFCLRKKIPTFTSLPELPDLEEGSFSFKEDV